MGSVLDDDPPPGAQKMSSSAHAWSQPSPSRVLPSSHVSFGSRALLPQVPEQTKQVPLLSCWHAVGGLWPWQTYLAPKMHS